MTTRDFTPLPVADLVVRAPRPDEAEAWARFTVREQRATYGDALPADFCEQHLTTGAISSLAESFAQPGENVRRMAFSGTTLLGIAATGDAPATWEVGLGLVPAPAARSLDRLYVTGEAHGTGVGAQLFDAVADDRPTYLWLIDGNDRAARFYERRGFIHLDDTVTTGPTWGHLPMHRMLRH